LHDGSGGFWVNRKRKKEGAFKAGFGEMLRRQTTPGNGRKNCKRRYIVREKRAEHPHVEIE